MKQKHIIIFGIISVMVLLGVFWKINHKPQYSNHTETIHFKSEFDSKNISQIILGKGSSEEIRLKKLKDGWKVESLENAPAQEESLIFFLNQVQGLYGEYRAGGEEALDEFLISDEDAYFLKLFDLSRKEILHLKVGLKRAGAQGMFIRSANSNRVYMTRTPLASAMGMYGDLAKEKLNPDFWTDKRVFQESELAIERMVVLKDEESFLNLKREKEFLWKSEDASFPFELDSRKIEYFLSFIQNSMGERFLGHALSPQVLKKPLFEIELRGTSNTYLMRIFKRRDDYILWRSFEKALMVIHQDTFEALNITYADLLMNNPLNLKSEEIESIFIYKDRSSTVPIELGGGSEEEKAYLLSRLENFKFVKIFNDINAEILKGLPPTHRLKIVFHNGKEQELAFYDIGSPEGLVRAILMGKNEVLAISQDYFDSIFNRDILSANS